MLRRSLFPLAASTALALSTRLLVAGAEGRTTGLIFGTTETSQAKMSKRFAPLLGALERHGVSFERIVNRTSVEHMIVAVRNGEVDVVFDTARNSLLLMDEAGMVPLLVREKYGTRRYNSVIFTRADSEVAKLEDLVGRVVAFEHPESTSSYQLPSVLLRAHGLELVESRTPAPGKVAYYFSNDDRSTLAQVRAGRPADAGGINAFRMPDNGTFRVVAESPFVPRGIVMVGPAVDRVRLEAALLAVSADPTATDALERSKTPTGFSRFEADPIETLDQGVRAALGM